MRTKTCLSCQHSDWNSPSSMCELCGPFGNWTPKTLKPQSRESKWALAIGDTVLVHYAAEGTVRAGTVVAVAPAGEDRVDVIYPHSEKVVSVHKTAILGIAYND